MCICVGSTLAKTTILFTLFLVNFILIFSSLVSVFFCFFIQIPYLLFSFICSTDKTSKRYNKTKNNRKWDKTKTKMINERERNAPKNTVNQKRANNIQKKPDRAKPNQNLSVADWKLIKLNQRRGKLDEREREKGRNEWAK